jgi:cytochrome b6-f complex iron-sulfur subunit
MTSRGTRRVSHYVDALLRDRRPPRHAPDPDDLLVLTTAITLSGARPQAGMPDPRFVERLEGRLREQVQGEFRRGGELSRRGLLRAGGLAAAAAAAGVVTDRLVTEHAQTSAPENLAVDGGRWHAVAAADAVPAGRALRFSTAAVEGVVVNRGGGAFEAMVAVCTHLGCTLQLDAARRRLGCPCGQAAFGLNGEVLVHPAAARLRPLPRIPTRVSDGMVEVHIV